MRRALVLDLRVSAGQHVVLGGITLVLMLAGALAGTLVFAWFMVGVWIASVSSSHRSLETLGPVGRLQTVLGVPRRRAVRARYVSVVLTSVVVVLGTGVVGAIWWATGRDLASARGMVAVTLATLAVAAVNLTLGYTSSARTQQFGLVLMALLVAGVGVVPALRGADFWGGMAELDAWLFGGPVPPVLVFAIVSVVVLVGGCRVAERAYVRADL